MKYINLDQLKQSFLNTDTPVITMLKVIEILKEQSTIDIVRCQDCKHWVYNFNGCSRNPCTEPWYATDFCNYGEREGE